MKDPGNGWIISCVFIAICQRVFSARKIERERCAIAQVSRIGRYKEANSTPVYSIVF